MKEIAVELNANIFFAIGYIALALAVIVFFVKNRHLFKKTK